MSYKKISSDHTLQVLVAILILWIWYKLVDLYNKEPLLVILWAIIFSGLFITIIIWYKKRKDKKINNSKNIEDMICNKCWWKMILRKAKKWIHEWDNFYWCSNFPKCKNTINISD